MIELSPDAITRLRNGLEMSLGECGEKLGHPVKNARRRMQEYEAGEKVMDNTKCRLLLIMRLFDENIVHNGVLITSIEGYDITDLMGE